MGFIEERLAGVKLPPVYPVRQRFDDSCIENAEAAVRKAICPCAGYQMIRPGMRVAITAGSRGIDRIPEVLRTVAAMVRERGAVPFLVPAMGSHGGATAEGQKAMLAGLGITEESVGAPILAGMEVYRIGSLSDGRPVFMDRYAHEADGIILVNRVKAHTGFRGEYESGLMKMMAIGLGKQKGAQCYHSTGFSRMAATVAEVGSFVLKKEKILLGLALVENGQGKLAITQALAPGEIPSEEKKLLKLANRLMPRPFFRTADVLVVKQIGKDISGTGMDSNVIGRFNNDAISMPGVSYTRIAALDLTEHSRGNANGMGFADFISRNLFRKVELSQTYPNVLTSSYPMTVRIPMILETDRQAVQAAVQTCLKEPDRPIRLGIIQDTKHLDLVYVSEGLLEEAAGAKNAEVAGPVGEIPFREDGTLALSF